jgi:hypothetical protein
MSYEWDNILRTELRTTFLLQINCKSYSTNIAIMDLPNRLFVAYYTGYL